MYLWVNEIGKQPKETLFNFKVTSLDLYLLSSSYHNQPVYILITHFVVYKCQFMCWKWCMHGSKIWIPDSIHGGAEQLRGNSKDNVMLENEPHSGQTTDPLSHLSAAFQPNQMNILTSWQQRCSFPGSETASQYGCTTVTEIKDELIILDFSLKIQ